MVKNGHQPCIYLFIYLFLLIHFYFKSYLGGNNHHPISIGVYYPLFFSF